MPGQALEILLVLLGKSSGLSDFSFGTTGSRRCSRHGRHHTPSGVPTLLELIQTVLILVETDDLGLIPGLGAVNVIKAVRVKHFKQVLSEILPTSFRKHGGTGCLHGIRVREVRYEVLRDVLLSLLLFKHRGSNQGATEHPGDSRLQPKGLVKLGQFGHC